ncbi:MAG: D-aminoacylase [Acidobacteria bacterium]|nr:D-aminoacylase [Acidobacteriota bacterium]
MAKFFLAFSLALAAQDFDLLIVNGRIVDGTGNASYLADVGVKDGKIAAMGRLGGRTARRTIDAKNLIVAPGFIDIHNHSDVTVLTDGNAQSMIRQGVTTMIFGEGESAAPSQGFARFTDYWTRLRSSGVAPNIGSYVGSSQIWTRVRGPKAGPPTAAELVQIRALVKQAMEDGALGVSSSLSGPPGAWIDTDTLVAMCEEASKFNGIYSTHMRTEGNGVFKAVQEAIEIGRRANVPVDVIHIKIADHKLWGKMPELIGLIATARANGQEVEAHVYPYRAGQNNLSSIIPPWAHEGGRAKLIENIKNPALKDRLRNEILNGIPGSDWYNHYTATGSWEGMLLASLSNPAYKKYNGRHMNEVIREIGGDPVDVLFKVLIDNAGSVPAVYFHHNEDDMRYAMRQPFVSIGSDGTAVATEGLLAQNHPHPRFYGTFPRVLGRYVREDKVITMEEAIRKMTSANASKIRVYDRGLLRPGFPADITVFDPKTVIDHATYDKPHRYATGIQYVAVNGSIVLDAGKHTGARPGTVITRGATPGMAAR